MAALLVVIVLLHQRAETCTAGMHDAVVYCRQGDGCSRCNAILAFLSDGREQTWRFRGSREDRWDGGCLGYLLDRDALQPAAMYVI